MKPNRIEDAIRFVASTDDNEQCWPWTGGTFSNRYGRFSLGGRTVLAHRAIYELNFGVISSGLFVMHKCNNKMCCNPKHLTVGTNSENQRHASTSGAFKVGESGIRGIGFDKKRSYWKAIGYRNGKLHTLYQGPHFEKAIDARRKWDKENGIYFDIKGNTK
jgi:hypothetical protein